MALSDVQDHVKIPFFLLDELCFGQYSHEEVGRIIKALCGYCIDETIPVLTDKEWCLFERLKRCVDYQEEHPRWRGGNYEGNQHDRNSPRYREWRTAVFVRDGYTCQHCGQRGGKLNAHHIKPFARYPE